MQRLLTLFILTVLMLSGCQGAFLPVGAPPTPTNIPAVSYGSPQPALSTPTPSATPLPTLTPTTTATLVPSPTPLHPMDVRAARQVEYPGSDIVLEQELERGANYRRYYASYLSDGLKIYGLLTIPNGEMPEAGFPAIVFNHGYIPPEVYRTTERYVAYVDWLARSGYVVFRIDYRGHDRSEGEPSGAYGSPGYTADVLNAVASLQRFPQVNVEKIGMWGHSMGGFLTLRAMVISPEVKAGVIWAGVVASYPDMLYRWRRPGPTPTPSSPSSARRWRLEWLEIFGSPERNPEFWQAVSANSYLADLSGPIQLHHGTEDESVPLEFSERLVEEIQSVGGSVEFYSYPGDNHNLSGYFSQAMTRTIEFFDRNLK